MFTPRFHDIESFSEENTNKSKHYLSKLGEDLIYLLSVAAEPVSNEEVFQHFGIEHAKKPVIWQIGTTESRCNNRMPQQNQSTYIMALTRELASDVDNGGP